MIRYKVFFLMLFLSAVGLCAGSFFEVYMEGVGKEQLVELLSTHFTTSQSSSFGSDYALNISSVIKLWAFLLLCPLFPILSIAIPFICMGKGLSLGFSATMLIEIFGIKGTWYILLSIFPQSVIKVPIFCFLATLSMEMSLLTAKFILQKRSRKKNTNALQQSARHYIIYFALALVILLISCLIEVFLKQSLL